MPRAELGVEAGTDETRSTPRWTADCDQKTADNRLQVGDDEKNEPDADPHLSLPPGAAGTGDPMTPPKNVTPTVKELRARQANAKKATPTAAEANVALKPTPPQATPPPQASPKPKGKERPRTPRTQKRLEEQLLADAREAIASAHTDSAAKKESQRVFKSKSFLKNLDAHDGGKAPRLKSRRKSSKVTMLQERFQMKAEDSGDDGQEAALEFDCEFESGNLGDVKQVDEYEYELKIRGDTNSTRHRVWFYFRVKGARRHQRVVFHISNYSKAKTLFREGFGPVVRSASRWEWSRLPASQIYYYKCSRHKKRYCFAFSFTFDRPEDYYFAYSYPYTYTDLQKWLQSIEYLRLPYVRRDLLARTILQRRVDLLTVTSPSRNKKESPETSKHAVYITSRVHPGETPASYVCHGLVEFLISDHPMAEKLRELAIFYIVPMLNPDGVFLGNYRCNSAGLDLNRQWRQPNWKTSPTITASKMLLRQLVNMDVGLEYYIDIHAHTTEMCGFLFCNTFNGPQATPTQLRMNELNLIFPRLLDVYAPTDFSFDDNKQTMDPTKSGTSRRALGDFFADKLISCYTMEVSFYCSSYQGKPNPPYTEEGYRELGRATGKALRAILEVPKEKRSWKKIYERLPDIDPVHLEAEGSDND